MNGWHPLARFSKLGLNNPSLKKKISYLQNELNELKEKFEKNRENKNLFFKKKKKWKVEKIKIEWLTSSSKVFDWEKNLLICFLLAKHACSIKICYITSLSRIKNILRIILWKRSQVTAHLLFTIIFVYNCFLHSYSLNL